MQLPRVHLFEFNERRDVPAFLQAHIVDALGLAQRWSRYLDPLVPVLAGFLREARADRVLDLCSGSGDATADLVAALLQAGADLPPVTLSDLIPDAPALQAAARRHPAHLRVAPVPVDATAVPTDLDAPARLILNGFHHLPPGVAARTLADAVAGRRALFIGEAFPRRFLPALRIVPYGLAALVVLPLRAPRDRLARFLSTWIFPFIFPVAGWDWTVSVLRQYTEADLRAMADRAGGAYRWTYQEVPGPWGSRLVAFWGVPVA